MGLTSCAVASDAHFKPKASSSWGYEGVLNGLQKRGAGETGPPGAVPSDHAVAPSAAASAARSSDRADRPKCQLLTVSFIRFANF